MKKLIAVLVLLAVASPVRAGLVTDFDPVEKNLTEKKQLEEDMGREFKKQSIEPVKHEPAKEEEAKSGSNWWKWALGIAVVGGIAAAAGGGGGGGGDGAAGNSTGSVTASW